METFSVTYIHYHRSQWEMGSIAKLCVGREMLVAALTKKATCENTWVKPVNKPNQTQKPQTTLSIQQIPCKIIQLSCDLP